MNDINSDCTYGRQSPKTQEDKLRQAIENSPFADVLQTPSAPPPLPHNETKELENHVPHPPSPRAIWKGRLVFGILTLLFGSVLLVYSLYAANTGLTEPPPMHRPYPHDIDPMPIYMVSAVILLFLAIVLLIGGGVFIFGGKRASRLYLKLGLSAPHKVNINEMPTLLVISALWHLSSIGLFVYMGLHIDNIPDLDAIMFGRFFLVLMQYGVFPAIMAPFCARGQRWALWTTFVVFSLDMIWRTIIYVIGAFMVFQGTISFSAVFDGRVLYWIMTSVVALMSLRWLRDRQSAQPVAPESTPATPPPQSSRWPIALDGYGFAAIENADDLNDRKAKWMGFGHGPWKSDTGKVQVTSETVRLIGNKGLELAITRGIVENVNRRHLRHGTGSSDDPVVISCRQDHQNPYAVFVIRASVTPSLPTTRNRMNSELRDAILTWLHASQGASSGKSVPPPLLHRHCAGARWIRT